MRDNISEILERVLDRGIVIEWWGRASLAGINVLTAVAHVVVTSLDTYLRHANELNEVAPIPVPSVEGRTSRSRGAGRPAPIRIVREAFDAWNGRELNRYRSVAVRPLAKPSRRSSRCFRTFTSPSKASLPQGTTCS